MNDNQTLNFQNYQTIECIHQGKKSLVYRAQNISNNQPVILKLLRSEYPSFYELVQFRHQYTMTKNLNLPGVVQPLALENYRNSLILVMADEGYISIDEYTQDNSLSLSQCLTIGIQLAEILAGLYQHRIIHKDIKPANILIHPATFEIQLIDFSIASLLPKETQILKNPNILEGTLAYISPEQTGRMNRGIDYRTDFYSFGVTLYELLSGKLPFETTEPMELVHCHIAKMPSSLSNRKKIPEVVSNIILKLMAKNAEERYQSAWGIQKDLETCLEQLENNGRIELFEIGKRDIYDHFIIPEKLYGRQQQVQQLLDAFERVANPISSQHSFQKGEIKAKHLLVSPLVRGTEGGALLGGSSEMILVAGYSGVGKTAVVNEVHKPIVRQRGYFIKGKFDQFQRNIPFRAFVIALRDLMGQLLSENDAKLQQWKDKILKAVGENGQVIIEVIPELEKIIGSQPAVTELSGTAAQNRFNLLFQKFIQVFTTKDHPLVIFLDDLQWVDSASLSLIKLLMSDGDSQYLLLIGAYRYNEVNSAHPLMLTLDEIDKNQGIVNTITLAPLQQNDLSQLVADTLYCSLQKALPLTQAVYQKTQGNPFFTTQFLKALYEDKLIYFNSKEGFWECDLALVKLASVSEDVVEFVSKRLQKLNPLTQDCLKFAACIGNQFDLETLAIVRQTSELKTATDLWVALKEGLILPTTEVYKFYTIDTQEIQSTTESHISACYKFLHDRIQQAAYSLIPEDSKKETHYKIGQLLLKNTPEFEREERIFEIVNQLNYGFELIAAPQERDELAQLNLIACRKARTSTAYQAGREYAKIGLSLLGENAWQHKYEMSLAFHDLAAEFASLCGDFEAMEKFIEAVITQAKSVLEQVNVYRIRIQANASGNKLTEAITIGLQLLQKFAINFPEEPTQKDIQQGMAEIDKLIGDREIENLVELPTMTDAEQIAIVQIVNSIMAVVAISGSPLYPLLAASTVKLSIQYGNTSASAIGYVSYGLIACNIRQDIEQGVKFGQLALQVVSQQNAKAIKPQLFIVMGLYILHRKSHIKETLLLLQEGYAFGLEVGDREMAGYNAQAFCLNSFWCGQRLATLEQETRTYCNGLLQLNQLTTASWCRMYLQSILNLLGVEVGEYPSVLSGEVLNETEFLSQLLSAHDRLGLYFFHIYKLMLSYLFGEIESAQNHAVEVKFYWMVGAGTFCESVFYFYDSLTALATLSSRSPNTSKILQQVEENQAKLQQQWAKHAPMNHQHKYDLVEAEKHRVMGKKLEAMELYDKAIAGAKANEYIQEEAIANELAAKFYLGLGRKKVAQTYMIEAYYCYSHWGAKAKIKDLEQRYPELLAPILEQQKISLNPFKTIASLGNTDSYTQSTINNNTAGISDVLDFTSVIKASQALSSQIELNQLICQLMQVMMENAGASKGVLILSEAEQLTVKAISNHNANDEAISCTEKSIPVAESFAVPVSIINLVKRRLEPLNLDQVSSPTQFASDDYFIQHQPQSLLCLPLCSRGAFLGILYLENNLTTGVFTEQRVEVLKLLCSQAAISLENAQLYQKSQDYAQQLEQSLTELQEAQVQLVQSEKMSALGQMMSGITHEINNPLGFISGNISQVEEAIQDLLNYLEIYQQNHPPGEQVKAYAEEIKLEYVLEDLPPMLADMQTGVNRIAEISKSMRIFSRSDREQKVAFDFHEGIDSTLLILKHRLKGNEFRPEINIIKDYGNLPQILGFPGQLNQVFMNIIANAIDVFDEMSEGRSMAQMKQNPYKIMLTTNLDDATQMVKISIQDNGCGMSEKVKNRIFNHLFTTKAVGKGTGLGLSIARQIVEEKHDGKLSCESQLGKGTEFVIEIPIGI
ncbi:ATP-binding sensor histidine kinase [Okeania sp. SIO2B3]|uniref:trifunctional serine/threonine-protein kinase/ATP-binding protein/sensor histidine kinase n=1 Tax=Okeania sp. SIO2B3 TaxID=2607784 RepID=UPI0013BFC145|nr:ATP-binding sensor histidine kinase [Okeania sp. SIO2B3]NET45617.1 AAA family ATPase [Okeania sp. SIO2B3]